MKSLILTVFLPSRCLHKIVIALLQKRYGYSGISISKEKGKNQAATTRALLGVLVLFRVPLCNWGYVLSANSNWAVIVNKKLRSVKKQYLTKMVKKSIGFFNVGTSIIMDFVIFVVADEYVGVHFERSNVCKVTLRSLFRFHDKIRQKKVRHTILFDLFLFAYLNHNHHQRYACFTPFFR